MPESSSRSFSRTFWRTLQVGVSALLVSAILFFGLTRTDVGRDGIRQQIESTFNQRYEGTLSIERLQGTLIDELIATNVKLEDPSGRTVARVDTVRATPRWSMLLTSELSFSSLLLQEPEVQLHRSEDGTWNASRAVRPRFPSSSNQSFAFSLARIQVDDGRVTTRRDGESPPLVKKDWLFDYTRTEVRDLRLNASIDWTSTDQLLDVEFLSFHLPDPHVSVPTARIQLLHEDEEWSLTRFDVSTEQSRVRASGSLQLSTKDPSSSSGSLRLSRSRIHHDEIRRLVPRLPLADVVTVQGEIEGRLDRLMLSDFTVTHGQSFFTAEGTLLDLPSSLNADLALTDSHLRPSDIQDVWPDFPLRHTSDLRPLDVSATVKGMAQWRQLSQPTFDLSGTIDAAGPQGDVQGTYELTQSASTPLQYAAQLEVDSLTLSPLPGTPAVPGHLNGRVAVDGQGFTARTLAGTVDVSLSPSRIGFQRISSAQASFEVADQQVEGSLEVEQLLGGTVRAQGTFDALGPVPTYEAHAELVQVDVAPPEGPLTSTQLNATLHVDGHGIQWHSLAGRVHLNVDSSTVRRADQLVSLPPHSSTLRLAEMEADRPRIQLNGSVASLTLDGSSLGPPLWRTAKVWGAAFREAARRELDKTVPLASAADSSGAFPLPPPTADPTSLRAAAHSALARTQAEPPFQVSGQLHLHQPEVIHAWWPRFPREATDVVAEMDLLLGLDTLRTTGRVSASRVRKGNRQVRDFEVQYQFQGPLDMPLAETFRGSVEVTAEQAEVGGPPLFQPKAAFSFEARHGTLNLHADRLGAARDLRVRSDVHIAQDYNELAIREASVTLGARTWSNPQPSSVQLYTNAVRVAPLILESSHDPFSSKQQLQIKGILSSSPRDTLSVEAQDLLLNPFAQLAGAPTPIGGQLTGRVDLTGGWSDPQLQGALTVQRLSYDRRVLGDLHLQSHYTSNSPDLILEGSLETKAASTDSLSGPPLVPGGPETVEPNRLQMSGRVRLPSWVPSPLPDQASHVPPGETLDLTVDVERADLFFFEYIFEERVASAQGFTTGTIHVGGQLYRPIFEATLDVVNGAARLPEFGLHYTVNGPVRVNQEGIHLQNVSVEDDQGTATVNGSILFNEYQFFSFDLRAQLDGISVIDVPNAQDLPFYGHIRGSGPLTLTGPLSDASLQSESVQTTPDSELFIPASDRGMESAEGFIIFADSTGQLPNLQELTRRDNILSDRPAGEPSFVEGLDIDLNLFAPEGSTVHLVFDPLVGDVVTAVGSGRVQLQRQEGEFFVYGTFNATSGSYLFTAGEVFVRRFSINEGTITWDGDPTNALLDLNAEYQTRASPAGLPQENRYAGRIPVTIELSITERVESPRVDLSLSLAREERGELVGSQTLDALLNQPDRTTEYATSVLLTNTFLLTTESFLQETPPGQSTPNDNLSAASAAGFNSVSQLVASQLNRYLGAALPNVDLNFGLQGENPTDLDVIYGIALRLLNERLIIRGEGVYTADDTNSPQAPGPQGEFVVEIRLSPRVSAEVFYRRSGEELTFNQTLTSSTGAGLSYQTEFSTWKDLFTRVFGWLVPGSSTEEEPDPETDPVARSPDPSASAEDTSDDDSGN